MLNQVGVQAQSSKTATITEKFNLGDSFGDRDNYEINLDRPGRILINAKWSGSATQLAIILNGPGQVGYYSRKDGNSPLKIDFNVTADLISKGKTWTISIINFGKRGTAKGSLKVTYPAKSLLIQNKLEVIRGKPPKVIGADVLDSSIVQTNTIQRKILEDGRVEIRYSDGTIRYMQACGYWQINPDGTESGMQCVQVPPVTPPSLPGDNRITTFLEWQTESLLEFIKILLNFNETSINNFLNYERENTNNLYGKMDLRTNYIDRLMPRE